ncbi:MAG: hypothetical protein ACFFED_05345 [Candidatus Thorarchaeota archaeon]
MQTLVTEQESKIGQIVESIKSQVRKRTARWLEYDEGARYQRCEIASAQALKDLEALKSGTRADSYRSSFLR